jgi:MFS family permease
MALVGLAPNVWVLYAALLMVAIGAAQIFPCLASLVTIYTPPHDRGRTMGVFRSTGAMGRVVGPLLVCIIYWRLGSTGAYLIAAAAMVAPLMLLALLPPAVEPPEWSVPESEAA